ncbi:MAG: flagellar motor protein [Planctomycetes bacterium]|nr:flagellar motor protein [Planctomycetota bacterium]
MIINILGIVVAFGMIVLGNHLEGGHLSSLMQPTAAIIVFGGTIGATMVAHTAREVMAALKDLKKVFLGKDPDYSPLVKQIVTFGTVARREGLLSLDNMLRDVTNPFMSENLRRLIDGYEAGALRNIMEAKIGRAEEEKNACAKVWETLGGFCPTVGILGAVLGLIHVMHNLDDPSKLGPGIAVAFVATVYGVGAANLVMLPIGSKLKKIYHHEMLEMELILTGILAIQAGENPRRVEDQLQDILGDHAHHDAAAAGEEHKAVG